MSVDRRWIGVLILGMTVQSLPSSTPAAEPDVFRTTRTLPGTPAGTLLDDGSFCSFEQVGEPLHLQEAVERALCHGVATRQAWSRIKVQAAGVGLAQAAYLPTVSVSLQDARQGSGTEVQDHPELSSTTGATVYNSNVALNWVLFDFGGRQAALANARELLAAAEANHDATLQTVFAGVAKDFYAAQGAQGAALAAQDIERSARDSFDAASRRVESGVAPISDSLQAETALAQATFNRAKANGDWQTALGVLANDMGLRPDSSFELPGVDEGVKPDAEFNESISELITRAQREHPSVLQAEAQLRAAQATIEQTRAAGRPTVSLVAKSTRDNQPAVPSLGLSPYPASGHDWSIGVQVTIPLFEGFGRTYQVRQASAQAELQGVAVDQARNQVAVDVWTSYQAIQTATRNVANSAKLLDIALASQDASQGRYLAGVGGILELLSAQTALATARQQRIQALTDWRAARLQLAARLGRLAKESLDGQ